MFAKMRKVRHFCGNFMGTGGAWECTISTNIVLPVAPSAYAFTQYKIRGEDRHQKVHLAALFFFFFFETEGQPPTPK